MKKKHSLLISAFAVIAVFALAACDYESNASVYFENATSGTVVVYQIDSLNIDKYYRRDPVTIEPGETGFVCSRHYLNYSPRNKDIPDVILEYYPYGLALKAGGKTYCYYPDSISANERSPFDENCYRIEKVDVSSFAGYNMDAYFKISDKDLNP